MPADGTASTILTLLREGRQQAQELAATLRIDTSAVRRHLETLREEGLVDAEEVIAGPGRPKKMYGLTSAGREAFPRDYALLLDLVLAKLHETGEPHSLDRLMGAIAADLAASIRGPGTPAKLDAIVAFYNRLGFDASLERTADGHVFTQRNCIFLKTAEGNPKLMCEGLDEGILRAALPHATVEFEGSLATGALRCTHRITTRATKGAG